MPCQEAASLNGSVLSAMPNGRHATGRASTIRCPRPRSGTAGPPIDAAERNAGAMPSMNCSPLQPEYVAWLDPLPDSLRATPTGESLQAIADLDLGARPRLIRPWLWTRLIRPETPTKPLTLRARYKAQERLCRKYRKLARAGKPPTVVTAAIARELAGFVWAIAKQSTC